MSGAGQDGSLGAAAEEAARLVQAAHGWWSRLPTSEEPIDHGPDHRQQSQCHYCPFCRGVAAAQQLGPGLLAQLLRPEVLGQLVSAADAVAAAVREATRDLREPGAASAPDPESWSPGVSIPVEDDEPDPPVHRDRPTDE